MVVLNYRKVVFSLLLEVVVVLFCWVSVFLIVRFILIISVVGFCGLSLFSVCFRVE